MNYCILRLFAEIRLSWYPWAPERIRILEPIVLPLSFPPLKNLLPALFYYLCLPFIYLLAILPFPLLYLFSYGVYLLLYRLLGYRRKVVRENLVKSFPEKKEKEIREIERKFYRYFFDLFLET